MKNGELRIDRQQIQLYSVGRKREGQPDRKMVKAEEEDKGRGKTVAVGRQCYYCRCRLARDSRKWKREAEGGGEGGKKRDYRQIGR